MAARLSICAGLVCVLAAVWGPSAQAAESDFLNRFAGSWNGSGMVQRKAEEKPTRVNCSMTGKPSANAVTISGTCRAHVIFTRRISADIRFDPGSGRYSGVYEGSTIGAARVSGKRSGDAVVLTITWPKEVNGDTSATMTIRNAGNGQLGITVSDKVGGANTTVTDLSLAQ